MNALQARFVARYRTATYILALGGSPSRLGPLLAEAVSVLGEDDPVTFMIACGVEEQRGSDRPIAESARAWTALRARAERVLVQDDPSLMTIRSFQVRYTRRSGGTTDLDESVQRYEAEWVFLRDLLGPDHPRARTAWANHALALRERGWDGDLETALTMLREEAEYRRARYGGDHPSTWTAQTILAQTLVRSAKLIDGTTGAEERPEAADGGRPLQSWLPPDESLEFLIKAAGRLQPRP